MKTKYVVDPALKPHMLPDEYVICQHPFGAQCTNYGKFVICDLRGGNRYVHIEGHTLLTDEMQAYLIIGTRFYTLPENNFPFMAMCEIIDRYGRTYGHVHNKVRDTQLETIKEELEAKLASILESMKTLIAREDAVDEREKKLDAYHAALVAREKSPDTCEKTRRDAQMERMLLAQISSDVSTLVNLVTKQLNENMAGAYSCPPIA